MELVHGVVAIASAQGIRLTGPMGEGGDDDPMIFNEQVIGFNGVGPESHESFYLERDGEVPEWRKNDPDFGRFAFCKTAHKPYDVVVVAALCVVETISEGHFRVSSDGREGAWQEGLELARRVLKDAKIPGRVTGEIQDE